MYRPVLATGTVQVRLQWHNNRPTSKNLAMSHHLFQEMSEIKAMCNNQGRFMYHIYILLSHLKILNLTQFVYIYFAIIAYTCNQVKKNQTKNIKKGLSLLLVQLILCQVIIKSYEQVTLLIPKDQQSKQNGTFILVGLVSNQTLGSNAKMPRYCYDTFTLVFYNPLLFCKLQTCTVYSSYFVLYVKKQTF